LIGWLAGHVEGRLGGIRAGHHNYSGRERRQSIQIARIYRQAIDEIGSEVALRVAGLRPLIWIAAAAPPADLNGRQLSGVAAHAEVRDEPVLVALPLDVT